MARMDSAITSMHTEFLSSISCRRSHLPMVICTSSLERDRGVSDREKMRNRGFTLVEVMISAALATMILAGVLAAFLMMGRSGYNASGYSTMDAEARRALERLGVDARMASNIAWTNSSTITLTVQGGAVVYAYDSSTTGTTPRCFYREVGGVRQVLIRDVADFAFCYYKVMNGVDYTALNPLETKQLQITLRTVRSRATVTSATNSVLSARIVLRNKKVST